GRLIWPRRLAAILRFHASLAANFKNQLDHFADTVLPTGTGVQYPAVSLRVVSSQLEKRNRGIHVDKVARLPAGCDLGRFAAPTAGHHVRHQPAGLLPGTIGGKYTHGGRRPALESFFQAKQGSRVLGDRVIAPRLEA